ncbi:MAG TPA: DNA mismatch repair protein MutS, partial [Armatimonadota bacterium]|nr:DNA mismatch repair protein MutS [Armatimonadota bacterium]
MSVPSDPLSEYTHRLQARQATAGYYAARDRALANWRLAVAAVALLLGWLAFLQHALSGWWLLGPAVAFVALVIRHDSVIREHRRAERAVRFYREGLRRLEDRWAGHGNPGERFLEPEHPYAADLDLFGPGSLFELLCTARTRAGEETLAAWLLDGAAPETVRARQEAVADLRSRLDLREELALAGEDVRSAVDAEGLVAWGAAPVQLSGTAPRIIAGVLAALTLAGAVAWALGQGPVPFLVLLLIEQGYDQTLRPKVRPILKALERPARDLELLSQLLARLEREPFAAPRLRELQAELGHGGVRASAQVARLRYLVGLLEAQRNAVFAPLGLVLLWPTQLAFEVEKWRGQTGPDLGRWVSAIGELEALSCLAGYAFEHPQDPFPELADE